MSNDLRLRCSLIEIPFHFFRLFKLLSCIWVRWLSELANSEFRILINLRSFLGLGLSWSGSGSGVSQNSVGTTDMTRTRSKSEAEISSLKDDNLSPAAESSPVSPQKLNNLAQIEIACCTSIPAEYGEDIRFEQR